LYNFRGIIGMVIEVKMKEYHIINPKIWKGKRNTSKIIP